MNINLKIYKFLFFIFLNSFGLNAQTVTTYFEFNQDQYVSGLATNFNGNLTFGDRSNWPPAIKTLDRNGTISTVVSGNYYPLSLQYDNSGNLYFIDAMNWPYAIQKVSQDGTVTPFVSDSNFFPVSITCDNLGNLFFLDNMNRPSSIYKVTPDGSVSLYVDGSSYSISIITSDNSGNIFFTDQSNGTTTIRKVSTDGTVSTLVNNNNNNNYIHSMTCDNSGNLYFLEEVNWPTMSIKKVLPDGSIVDYVSNDPNLNYANNLISDNEGNLFYKGYTNNFRQQIMIVTNPNYVCFSPNAPTTTDNSICTGNTTNLTANGIGKLRWYDAPMNGNLLATGNNFTTPILATETTYYVEGFFCNLSSNRTPVTVSAIDTPVAAISGDTTGNDFVKLTATGVGSYLWSGGYSPTDAVNYFTRSGSYSLTVTNTTGCSSTTNVNVVVNKLGINKFGQLINNVTEKVNKNGTINAEIYVNKHGKSASSVADGNLNYAVFSAPASFAINAINFSNYTNPSNQTASGTHNATLLLDWVGVSTLTSAGISIPNGGDRFAIQVSGFFIPSENGTYTFTCEGDDAVDLFIDGINVANHYGGHPVAPLGTNTGTINLVKGTKYTFRARMQDNDDFEGLRVLWRKPSEISSSGWNIYTDELSSF